MRIIISINCQVQWEKTSNEDAINCQDFSIKLKKIIIMVKKEEKSVLQSGKCISGMHKNVSVFFGGNLLIIYILLFLFLPSFAFRIN